MIIRSLFLLGLCFSILVQTILVNWLLLPLCAIILATILMIWLKSERINKPNIFVLEATVIVMAVRFLVSEQDIYLLVDFILGFGVILSSFWVIWKEGK